MKQCKARNCALDICLWDASNVCLQEKHLAVLLISSLLISVLDMEAWIRSLVHSANTQQYGVQRQHFGLRSTVYGASICFSQIVWAAAVPKTNDSTWIANLRYLTRLAVGPVQNVIQAWLQWWTSIKFKLRRFRLYQLVMCVKKAMY